MKSTPSVLSTTCVPFPRRLTRGLLVGLVATSLLLPSLAGAQEGTASPQSETSAMGASKDMGEVSSVSEEELKIARLHFSNGVNLLQETPPNYQDAWQQFRLALDKSGGSWKVRGNLGYCALKLERDGEALEHYRLYLEQGGDDIDPKERADIERELLLLEGNMSWVTISSSDPEAQLAVSRKGSSAPAQAYELSRGEAKLGLRAGDFMITAKSGDHSLTWEPLLTPGKKDSFHFDFAETQTFLAGDASPQEQTATEEPVAPAPQRGPSTMQWVGYGTLGLGALVAGGGLIAGLGVQGKEDTAKEGCIGTICPEADEDKKKSAQNLARTANILLISGGVLAATGVMLVLVGGSSEGEESAQAPAPQLALTPGITSGGGALFLRGSY